MYKTTGNMKLNPWGDDSPEKLSQKLPKTIGFKQGLKSLFSPDSFFEQMLGPKSHEIKPAFPKEVPFKKQQETVLFSYEQKRQECQLEKETQIIMRTLQEQVVILEKAGKTLAQEVSKVKLEKAPKKTGIYYIIFLEWLLSVVKQLRMKVEEGQAWLNTFMQKKKKRMGYWGMYKKHGTTFGLSQERSTATQTG